MPQPPSGTVTLLFTDIEGSTRLWETHPDAMSAALAKHDALLRATIESAGGYVFKTVGDAFCAAFAMADDAIAAAVKAQRCLHAEVWPEGANLRVRIAVHTGECEERDGDYFGPEVNRTARLAAATHGGQTVMSRTTARLIGDRLAHGTGLIELGSHRLKDLDRPEEVFQLTIDGIPADFPPLRSEQTAVPTNLTESLSSFVGRDDEVAAVVELVRDNRLVTLTGSGGVGKSRLAVEVGKTLLADVGDGVWLVELAAVSSPGSVAAEILSELGIREQPGNDAFESLVEVLATQDRLLILDNCEHVIAGCATVADAIVRRCPEIRLLTTSREPLRVEGEVVYRVPSLSLPPEHVDDRRDLAGSGAVALFVERAGAQGSGFALRDDNAQLVADICRQLDGMPLGLELATARLRSMSLGQIHDRLEHRFRLLSAGSRVALPRHQTLRALVDWSYDLLTDPERALLQRLSVFVGDFDLDAAEGVCDLDDLTPWEIADLMASLIDKSLVAAGPHRDTHRYRLQETLREYAGERLAETGAGDARSSDAELVAAAHTSYYLRFAEDAAPELDGRSGRAWMRRLIAEDANLRAAIERALGATDGAGRVLAHFWSLHRYWTDAPQPARTLALLELALEKAGRDVPRAGRAEALMFKAILLSSIDRRRELDAASAARGLARDAGDRALEADALSRYSRLMAQMGRDDEALAAGAEAVELARGIDDEVLLGTVLFQYASVLDEADAPGAEAAYVEALAVVERSGNELTAWKLHNNYALFLLGQANLAEARHHFESALIGTELTSRSAQLFLNVGWLFLEEGDHQHAASRFGDVLRTTRLNGMVSLLPYAVLGLACCATHRGTSAQAALLHGGADALRSKSSDQWEGLEDAIRAREIAVLRGRIGDDYDRLHAEGQRLRRDEIIKLATESVTARGDDERTG